MIAGPIGPTMPTPLTLQSLPLFPLQTVLFPGGTLPLRVFEVRYLDMVRKCQSAGAPFGVVSLTHGKEVRQAGAPDEQFSAVGTLASIEQLEAPQPGLITLTARGTQRFRVRKHRLLPHGLWVADVELLPQDLAVAVPTELQSIALALDSVQRSLQARQGSAPKPSPPNPLAGSCGWVANRWCELLPMPQAIKLQLLELDNPLLRLELVGDVLTGMNISH